MAAANYARKALLNSSTASAKTAFLNGFSSKSSPSLTSNAAKLGGFASPRLASSPLSRPKLSFLSRLPVHLGAVQSLMPLHSVTASALLTSMLRAGNWGWLSEEFATPL